jgi:hypothetical protein
VAYVLAKAGRSKVSGREILLDKEAAELKAGKFYVSAVGKEDPRASARADFIVPADDA